MTELQANLKILTKSYPGYFPALNYQTILIDFLKNFSIINKTVNKLEYKFTPEDLSFIKTLITTSGKMSLDVQRSNVNVRRKKDLSIVTQADEMVQELIISKLSVRFPFMKFIHEENFDPSTVKVDDDSYYAIIDPIDGTSMFSMYLPIWAVSVGIFKGFTPMYGFVFSPASEMFFYNDDENSYLNGSVLKAKKNMEIESESNLFYASEIQKIFTIEFPGKIRNLGSTALHACLTADNERNRTAAFIGKSYIWDWAGAIPVILKAGVSLSYINGNKINFKDVFSGTMEFCDFVIAHNTSFENVKKFFIKI